MDPTTSTTNTTTTEDDSKIWALLSENCTVLEALLKYKEKLPSEVIEEISRGIISSLKFIEKYTELAVTLNITNSHNVAQLIQSYVTFLLELKKAKKISFKKSPLDEFLIVQFNF